MFNQKQQALAAHFDFNFFQQGLLSSWPLLFYNQGVLVQISLLFENIKKVSVVSLFSVSTYVVASIVLEQLLFCSQFLCMLAFSYQVYSVSVCLVFLNIAFVRKVDMCVCVHVCVCVCVCVCVPGFQSNIFNYTDAKGIVGVSLIS